ncbi:MAG: ArsR family transcriptional regulator [Deltaproteobacteria bacterium]|nr:MAG: ArsR family transcriptional regulator [Deltaproteobacteria bacterium]
MNRKTLPTHLYEEVARMGRAFGSPERLRLLDLLAQGERSVEVLAATAGMGVRTASHHLQQLKVARLVACRKEGRFAIYSLADESVGDFWAALRRFAQNRSAELQASVAAMEGQRPPDSVISRARAKEAQDRRTATFVDVRPVEEFRTAHIVGAHSMPLSELTDRVHALPKAHLVVAYCRGAHCLLADQAVAKLRELDIEAQRLEEGILEWRNASLPIATESSDASS